MKTEKDLSKQLEEVLAMIDEARRELKALRRSATEGARGKARDNFLTGKQRMLEADEAARQLDRLKQEEREIRAKLHSGDS